MGPYLTIKSWISYVGHCSILLRCLQTSSWFRRHCMLIYVQVYMDEVQPAAAQHGKDGRSVVCVIEGGPGLCSVRPVCWKFGYPSCLRPVDKHAYHTNCFLLICCFATNTQQQSIRHSVKPSCSSCHWSFHGCTRVARSWPAFIYLFIYLLTICNKTLKTYFSFVKIHAIGGL